MTSFRLRPKFVHHVHHSPEEVTMLLQNTLAKENYPFSDLVFPGNYVLQMRRQERKFFSPQLNMALESDSHGCTIRGRYTPHPNVWTLFVLLYLALGVSLFFVMIMGLTRLSLGMPAQVLWLALALVGAAGVLYLLSQMGQKLAAGEMFALHFFVERALDTQISIR